MLIWPLGQAVKTPPFHGGNRGSIPLGVTICGYRISVILQPSKLERWVRFPLPAPKKLKKKLDINKEMF